MDDLYVEAIKKLARELSFAVWCPIYPTIVNKCSPECPAATECMNSQDESCDELLILWATKGEGV
ncbi:MAG: hypothetical protein RBS17_07460 [Coriobacteriia bacterium]|nr:hypothetical protein [Coriobacteriia bacterium]